MSAVNLNAISQERLQELFHYDENTGIFVRRNTGRITGTIQNGYYKIKIESRMYYAHRLAWLYVTGEYPEKQIDHINRNSLDNRFINLRLATAAQNKQNSTRNAANSSGFKGVSWNNKLKKWKSMIRLPPVHFYIGDFENIVDAAIAYNYHAAFAFGEFAAIVPIHLDYTHD